MTTREQKLRLRELESKMRNAGRFVIYQRDGSTLWASDAADELASILNEEVEVSDADVERSGIAYNRSTRTAAYDRSGLNAAITAALKEAGK